MIRRPIALALLVVVLVLAGVAAAAGGPEVSTTVHTYAVTGSTAAQLRAALDRRGPGGHDARTDWYVRWRYRYDETSAGCAFTSVQVTVEVTFRMPSWTPPRTASGALVAKWRRYLVLLRKHENGHRDIGIAVGRKTFAGLTALGPRATCSRLESAAHDLGQGYIAAGNRADVAYDRRTRHGETQGAVFP